MTTIKKKIGAYIFAFVLLIIVVLTIAPLLFKNKIKQSLLSLTDKELNTQVQIENFEIGLFENFPNITFSLKNVLLRGINGFANDTLLQAKKISLTFDSKSLLAHKYNITSIKISDAYIETKLDSEANFNWDILKIKSHQADTTKHFKSNIKSIELTNTKFRYINLQSNSDLTLFDINAELSGELRQKTIINFKAESNELTFSSNGRSYISKLRIETESKIDADFENKTFSTKNSRFQFNDLQTVLNGSISIIEAEYNFNLNMKAPKADFSQILSLVPTTYNKEFKTSGSVNLEADLIGDYTSINYPNFNLSLLIDNAKLQYSSKAIPIDDIKFYLNINAKPNDLSIAIEKFNFCIGNDKVESKLSYTPLNNPTLEGEVKGKINLASLKDVFSLENNTPLDGKIEIDLNILTTFDGEGMLNLRHFSLKENSTLKKFETLLNIRKLDSIATNNISIPFMIKDGTVYTEAFYLKFNNDINLGIEGYTKLDRSINYKGNINLPPYITNGIVSNIPFTVSGTLSNPKVDVKTQISTSGIIANFFKRSPDQTQDSIENK